MTSSSRDNRRSSGAMMRMFGNINMELDNYDIGDDEDQHIESLFLNVFIEC